jgi:hypothetical protein
MASSLTRLYTLFRDVGYIAPEDLRFPPHAEGELDVKLCRRLGMNKATVEFLQKIPWAKSGSAELVVGHAIIDFSNVRDLTRSRTSLDCYDHRLDSHPELPRPTSSDGSLVSLTYGEKGEAGMVVNVSHGERTKQRRRDGPLESFERD